jgi:hypothetical protein
VLQAIATFDFATQTHDTLLLRGISYLKVTQKVLSSDVTTEYLLQ